MLTNRDLMSPPNDATITELEALDRRLLALAGDVQSPLAHEVAVVGVRGQIPDGAEVDRIEVEFTAIWSSLIVIAEAAGVAVPDDVEARFSRFDAEAAYAAMQRRLEHQRRWVGAVRERVTGVASPGPEVDGADDPTSRDAPGHLRRWLTPWGASFIILPLILGLLYAAHVSDRTDRRAAAVRLCSRPSPCPGDAMTIAFGRIVHRGTQEGLVLVRRSADCSHEVEVYHDTTGDYRFRGSLADPDPVARAEFRAARERWHAEHEIVSTVPCERADEL